MHFIALLFVLAAASQESITTAIDQARPPATFVTNAISGMMAGEATSLTFPAGYWTMTLRSYCLDIGRHGPDDSSGYLLAPLQGSRASIVSSVVERSIAHPEIEQSDVQELIWSIDEQEPFNSLNDDFRQRVSALLTADQIAAISGQSQQTASTENAVNGVLGAIVPSEVQEAVNTAQELRDKLADPNATFEEITGIAIPSGSAGPETLDRDVSAGTWSYAGNNTYLRFFPDGFSTVRVEALDLDAVFGTFTTDSLGRITKFTDEFGSITTAYENQPSTVTTPDGRTVQAWRFKSVVFRGKSPSQKLTFSNKGYVEVARAESAPMGIATHARGGPADAVGGALRGDSVLREGHYRNGLNSIVQGPAAESRWVQGHLRDVALQWTYDSCVLRGECAPPDPDHLKPDKPRPHKFTGDALTPGNHGTQRLVLGGPK